MILTGRPTCVHPRARVGSDRVRSCAVLRGMVCVGFSRLPLERDESLSPSALPPIGSSRVTRTAPQLCGMRAIVASPTSVAFLFWVNFCPRCPRCICHIQVPWAWRVLGVYGTAVFFRSSIDDGSIAHTSNLKESDGIACVVHSDHMIFYSNCVIMAAIINLVACISPRLSIVEIVVPRAPPARLVAMSRQHLVSTV